MKLIIAGGRELIIDVNHLGWIINYFKLTPSEVVCGMARGMDMRGKEWADQYKIPVIPFKPDYDKYPKWEAPKIRNQQMAEYGTDLLLVWDGDSGGSFDMKQRMECEGKFVYEVILRKV